MNQKLIFNIIIAIILTAVLAFFALVLLNDEQQLDPQNNPDSIVPSNPVNTSIQTNQTNNNQGVSGFSVVGDQLNISNSRGQEILIDDFRSDDDVEQNNSFVEAYSFEQKDNFKFFFYGDSGEFILNILDEDYQQALIDAKNYLLKKLEISESEICYLKIDIGAPDWVSIPANVTNSLELPGC